MTPSKKPSAFVVWVTSASIHACLLIMLAEWTISRPEWTELTASLSTTPLGDMVAAWYGRFVTLAWIMAALVLPSILLTNSLRALARPVGRKLWRWLQWTAVNLSLLASIVFILGLGLMPLNDRPSGQGWVVLWFLGSLAAFVICLMRAFAEEMAANERRAIRV